jgi:hypothetical protein
MNDECEHDECEHCAEFNAQIEKDLQQGLRRLESLSVSGKVDEFINAIPEGITVGDVMLLLSAASAYTLCQHIYDEDQARYMDLVSGHMTTALVDAAKVNGNTCWREGPTQ